MNCYEWFCCWTRGGIRIMFGHGWIAGTEREIRDDPGRSALALSEPHRQGCAGTRPSPTIRDDEHRRNMRDAGARPRDDARTSLSMGTERPSAMGATSHGCMGFYIQGKHRLVQGPQGRGP